MILIYFYMMYVHIDRTDVWHRQGAFRIQLIFIVNTGQDASPMDYCLRSLGREPCPVCAAKKT